MKETRGKDLLVSWLRDAHAMEKGLIPVLEDHAEHADGHPEVQRRISQHKTETERHAQLVEECLESLGSDSSGGKDLVGRMMLAPQSKISASANDTMVKDSLMDFAVEHFEIASYRALVKAAEAMGETRIADTCRQILSEEEDMARFLDEHLSPAVEASL